MKRWMKWLVGGAIGIAGAGLAIASSKRTLRNRSILHVGDSHVGGLRYRSKALVEEAGGSYTPQFMRGVSTPRFVVHAPETVSQVVSVRDVDYVIVTLGTNDRVVNADVYATAVRAVIHEIQMSAPTVKVIWWGPPRVTRPDIADGVDTIAEIQRSAVQSMGATFVDSRSQIADGGDGVHFTADGYARWAEFALGETFRLVRATP